MATRKSSITAQLTLAGQAQFKSGLSQIGMEANKLGKTLREMKPITFDGGANQAKKAWALTEEHQRAHHRVMERQAKVNQARMDALGPMGGAKSGRAKGGGGGSSYGLGVGYNAIQDLVQGGPAAIANNIPQIIELVAKSPMLKVLGVAAAAAAAGYGMVKVAQYAYSETDAGNEDISARNYAKGRAEADRKKFEREKKEADTRSTAIAAAGRQTQENFGGVIDQEVGQVNRNYQLGEGSAIVAEKLQRTKLKAIKDDEQRINALADEEKKAVQAAYDRNNMRINQILQIAAQEEANARLEYQEADATLQGLTNAAPNSQDARIKEQMDEKMIGIEKRMKDAKERLKQVQEDYNEVKQQGIEIDGKQAEIDEQRKNDLSDLTDETKRLTAAEYERFSNEFDAEQKRQAAAKKKEEKAQKKATDEEKDRQSIRDRLTGEEELLNMSPRKRAKAERELKKTKDIEELQKKGFGPEEAASMAERGIKLEEANDPSKPKRIRGAGFGKDDASRDRRTTFGALDALEAFQPATGKERKTIKGAGNKDEDKKSGVNDRPETPVDSIVQGLARVERAIREGNPNATERGKPSSTRTSTATA
jgi:hypothetical protein